MKSATKYRLKVAGAALLAFAAAVCATAAGLAAARPSLDIPVASDLAPVREARAIVLAETPATARQAMQENAAVLAVSPLNTDAYLRQAYIQSRSGRALDAASLEALDRSYSVEPFGAVSGRWRLGFMFEHWSQVTPALRRQAAQELTTRLVAGKPFKPLEIRDPSGRMAAVLLNTGARRQRAAELAAVQGAGPTG